MRTKASLLTMPSNPLPPNKHTHAGFVDLVRKGSGVRRPNDEGDGSGGEPHEGNSDPVGTVTHMAPELLEGSSVEASVDIYSFGILMWEIFTGRAPYSEFASNNFADVPKKVARENLRPRFPAETPPLFMQLATACWSGDPARRPTSPALVARLQSLLDESCGGLVPAAERLGVVVAVVIMVAVVMVAVAIMAAAVVVVVVVMMVVVAAAAVAAVAVVAAVVVGAVAVVVVAAVAVVAAVVVVAAAVAVVAVAVAVAVAGGS
ncbi:hypothetical protein GPECTOR_12g406 [Gonium pectorale]|uniref:Protein kinase domain-containing protein n=1 Tax=Gonium pectorale TaxID=33097 RepID=A0A150GNM6_GONPE|nr:hypothetical protein GPECTOR_12g406 [Gonium pectorale]|eukprot:KXZ51443.1 hypothetical protein GPECTOR_12g406 [Gonium pectorale]